MAALLDGEFRFVGVGYGPHQSQFKQMLCVNLVESFLGAPEPLDYPQHDARLPNREDGDFTDLTSQRVECVCSPCCSSPPLGVNAYLC